MIRMILFVLCALSPVNFAKAAPKQTYQVSIELSQSGEFYEDCEEQWKANEDGGCTYKSSLKIGLPWSFSTGDFTLEIDKNGVAGISYSYGDADGGGSGTVTLPLDNKGALIFGQKPYVLEFSSSENASGAWSAEAILNIAPVK